MPILLALLAAAQQPAPPIPTVPGQPPATMVVEPVAMMISGFDANGDGRITRAECETGVKRSFATIDGAAKGSVGYIGYGDWALAWLGDRAALPSPYTVDADGDNRITLAELTAAIDRVFDRLDSNHDGVLTHSELLTIRAIGTGDPLEDRRRGKRRKD